MLHPRHVAAGSLVLGAGVVALVVALAVYLRHWGLYGVPTPGYRRRFGQALAVIFVVTAGLAAVVAFA